MDVCKFSQKKPGVSNEDKLAGTPKGGVILQHPRSDFRPMRGADALVGNG
jgi:hypothetical protein